ncbi:MAG: replication factor C large subunit, partial [Thermoplasmata archaeon]|nr:replication factor C large subunit [Thermoplasmata archaeon]
MGMRMSENTAPEEVNSPRSNTPLDWPEKHRPRTLAEVVGQRTAVKTMREWGYTWEHKIPEKKALLLYGPPGTGKTSAALALAGEMGWGVVEVNASDVRNAEAIRRIIGAGALNETFSDDGEFISSREGRRKLLVVDEADSLYERGGEEEGEALDKGGRRALLRVLEETVQPMIIIVNDLYALTRDQVGKEIKSLCVPVVFKRVHYRTMATRLMEVAEREGIRLDRDAAEEIARKARGDMRGALNDLEALALGRKRIRLEDVSASGLRDVTSDMWEVTSLVLKSRMEGKRALEKLMDIGERPEFSILWIDENMPAAYRNPLWLYRGYEALSRADLYLRRAKRRNQYRLWVYANFFMTVGVATAKQKSIEHIGRLKFPSWLMMMSGSKEERRLRSSVAEKIGHLVHTSKSCVLDDVLPYFQYLFQNDEEFRVYMTARAGLEEKDVAFLLRERSSSPVVREVVAKARELAPRLGRVSAGDEFGGGRWHGEDAGGKKEKGEYDVRGVEAREEGEGERKKEGKEEEREEV